MVERDFKTEFLEYLRSLKDRGSKNISYGLLTFSVRELIQEVELDSEVGLKFVDMFKNDQ